MNKKQIGVFILGVATVVAVYYLIYVILLSLGIFRMGFVSGLPCFRCPVIKKQFITIPMETMIINEEVIEFPFLLTITGVISLSIIYFSYKLHKLAGQNNVSLFSQTWSKIVILIELLIISLFTLMLIFVDYL